MTQSRRCVRRHVIIGHFLQKTTTIGGSFAERDLQIKVFRASSPPCIWCSWVAAGNSHMRHDPILNETSLKCRMRLTPFLMRHGSIFGWDMIQFHTRHDTISILGSEWAGNTNVRHDSILYETTLNSCEKWLDLHNSQLIGGKYASMHKAMSVINVPAGNIHCITVQHTATHCNTLQLTALSCNTPQHTATHCNTLQHTATRCNTLQRCHAQGHVCC